MGVFSSENDLPYFTTTNDGDEQVDDVLAIKAFRVKAGLRHARSEWPKLDSLGGASPATLWP